MGKRLPLITHHLPLVTFFSLKQFADRKNQLTFACVAEGGGHRDDTERCLGDDTEVDILPLDGLREGRAHLSVLVGAAKVEATAEGCGQGVNDASNLA